MCVILLTSPCHTGLVVLAMMEERLSWPWWVNLGSPLLFPGWMDIFRYGSGLKNMPFFRPTARMSGVENTHSSACVLIYLLDHNTIESVPIPDRVKLTSFRQCSVPDWSSDWPSLPT